ncbi:copper ion binding protein [Anaerosolibacter carboniphilus]|uniref:Copper ion binding protein n=1 Tax=Anaerosolibacter carboniphilus TaxID=1417629 RepID=A0A841KTE4_9FIRM|nr:copper ion binding protein [Anaerosolibacter carboniphilus]MBB6215428.1 copper ion binding protein [Anaerosolibacter carboniphilus]
MKKLISIEGMSCGHCIKHVESALGEIDGIVNVVVDLNGKNAVAEMSKDVEDTKLKAAIEEAGYDVISIRAI